MFDRILIRACVIVLSISFIGLAIIVSGVNLSFERVDTSSPVPRYVSVDELEAMHKVIKEIEEIEVVKLIDAEQYECLVKNIYFEARNQPVEGKEAIAVVTLERAKSERWPDNICDVVKERRKNKAGRIVCQFSWQCDGKSDEPKLSSKAERAAWERAETIAERAILGDVDSEIKGATHFHATYVKPIWRLNMTKLIQIGDHIFYKET